MTTINKIYIYILHVSILQLIVVQLHQTKKAENLNRRNLPVHACTCIYVHLPVNASK